MNFHDRYDLRCAAHVSSFAVSKTWHLPEVDRGLSCLQKVSSKDFLFMAATESTLILFDERFAGEPLAALLIPKLKQQPRLMDIASMNNNATHVVALGSKSSAEVSLCHVSEKIDENVSSDVYAVGSNRFAFHDLPLGQITTFPATAGDYCSLSGLKLVQDRVHATEKLTLVQASCTGAIMRQFFTQDAGKIDIDLSSYVGEPIIPQFIDIPGDYYDGGDVAPPARLMRYEASLLFSEHQLSSLSFPSPFEFH